MTRGPRLGAYKDLTFSGLGYLHLLVSSLFCPELSAWWVLSAAVLATGGAAAASSPRGPPWLLCLPSFKLTIFPTFSYLVPLFK